MSGFRHIEIACDGPNGEPYECGNSFYALAHTMASARREARACDWVTGRPGGKDYCPTHRQAGAASVGTADGENS